MRCELEEWIPAPVEDVFRRSTDFAGAPATMRGIQAVELLTPGPVGLGTRFRETRVMLGKQATEEMEVTAFDPPRSYVLGAENHGMRYRTELAMEPQRGGTRLTLRFEAVPTTLVARVLSLLMRPLARMAMGEMRKDLADLRASFETPPAG